MKYGEYKKIVYQKIDEYESTNTTDYTDDEDLQARFPHAFNEATRFVFYGKNIKRTWHVYQGKPFNQLTETEDEHRNEDVVFTANGAYAYYFEIDGTADIYVYAGENIIDEIHHVATDKTRTFVAYKGKGGDGNMMKIVFSGDYYYRINNVCLYNANFENNDRIPDYSGSNEHEIPYGLYQIERVYRIDGGKTLVPFAIRNNKLVIPEDEGVYEIESTFFPDKVTEKTSNETEIDIPIDTEFVVINKICSLLSGDAEYSEFVSDTEQGMQMLENRRSKPTVIVRTR